MGVDKKWPNHPSGCFNFRDKSGRIAQEHWNDFLKYNCDISHNYTDEPEECYDFYRWWAKVNSIQLDYELDVNNIFVKPKPEPEK